MSLCLKWIVHTSVGIFLFHWYIFMSMPCCFVYCSYIANFESRRQNFVLLCGQFKHLSFHIHLILTFSISLKYCWSFSLHSNLYINFGRIVILVYKLLFDFSQQSFILCFVMFIFMYFVGFGTNIKDIFKL